MKTNVKNHLLVLFLLLFIQLCGCYCLAQNPLLSWVKGGTRAAGYEHADCIGTDAAGFVYTAVGFAQGTSFDTSSSFMGGTLLLKYKPNGELLWARNIGAPAMQMHTDLAGNCYVTGAFGAIWHIGQDTLEHAGNSDVFVAKFDSAGNALWARKAGSAYTSSFLDAPREEGLSIETDGAGNSYVGMKLLSSYNQPATIGSVILYPNDTTAPAFITENMQVIAKYSPQGDLLWARRLNHTNGEGTPIDLAVTQAGECYFTGKFVASHNICIGRVGEDGTIKWVKNFGSTGFDMGTAVTINHQQQVLFAGVYEGNMQMGNFTLTNPNPNNSMPTYLITCDSTGNVLQAGQTQQNIGDLEMPRIIADASGAVYMSGDYWGTITVGNQTFYSSFYGDPFVIKWSSNCVPEWMVAMPTADAGRASGIVLNPSQTACYVYGSYGNSIVLGDTTLYESEPHDGFFLAKLENIVTGLPAEIPETNWSVYPNPTSGLLHLKLPLTAQPAKAVLTDVCGQEVFAATLSRSAEATLELPKLAAGVYVLSIETEKEILQKKIVVQ